MSAVLAGGGLLSTLLVLESDRVTVPERNAAAHRLYQSVLGWVGPFVRRVAPCGLDADDVDEVLQHLLMRCATGTARFRGTTEGEAHAFCRTVLQNKAHDLCRKRRRLRRVSSDEEFDQAVSQRPERLPISELNRILAAVLAELPRFHRASDVEGLERSIRCFVESRLGDGMDEQLETYGFDGEADERRSAAAITRAKNRVYTYRKRGREAASEALASLVAQGRFSDTDVADVRQLLGCGVVAEARREKKILS